MNSEQQQRLVEQYLDTKSTLPSKQDIVLVDSFQPVRNRTSREQEERVFAILWDMISETSVPEEHILMKYKTDYLVGKAKAEYGLLWYYEVIAAYSAYRRSHVSLLNLIEWKCYADESMRQLFRRYKSEQELSSIFRWPSKTSIHDEN
jgi:hypothetical protein